MTRRMGLIVMAMFLVIGLIFWHIVYSDSPASDPTYRFLYDDTLCILPCWENITPGQSSRSDVLEILDDRLLIERDSIRYPQANWLYFLTPTDDRVSIYFRDEKVQRIDFIPGGNFVLNSTIQQLGEPTRIYVRIEGVDYVFCHAASLYYPQQGVVVETASCEKVSQMHRFEKGNLMANTPVVLISFIESRRLPEDMLESF